MTLRHAIDGAAPDSGGKVGVFVGLPSEKSCADQRLEGAVDERRVESGCSTSSAIGAGVMMSALAQPSPDAIAAIVWNAAP